jgi:hypothetical protein
MVSYLVKYKSEQTLGLIYKDVHNSSTSLKTKWVYLLVLKYCSSIAFSHGVHYKRHTSILLQKYKPLHKGATKILVNVNIQFILKQCY